MTTADVHLADVATRDRLVTALCGRDVEAAPTGTTVLRLRACG